MSETRSGSIDRITRTFKVLKGESVEKSMPVEVVSVTKANVADFAK